MSLTTFQRRALFRASREGVDVLAEWVESHAHEQRKLAVAALLDEQRKATPWGRFMAWWDRTVNGENAGKGAGV